MFPIRDHNPSLRTPYVTYALIAINVIVFIGYWGLFSSEARLAAFFDDWALTPAEFSRGIESYTIVSSMFLHGGIMHLLGNMLFLFIFGDNLEDAFGHVGFLLFYLASGVLAALAQIVPDPNSMVPMVGASGAIAGVMGGYLLLFPKARVDVLVILIIIIRIFTVPAWVMLGFWFALQSFSGFSTLGAEGGGVAYLAHVGGFVAGVVLALPWFLRAGGTTFWRRNHGHPPHPETKIVPRQSTIPTVRRRRR